MSDAENIATAKEELAAAVAQEAAADAEGDLAAAGAARDSALKAAGTIAAKKAPDGEVVTPLFTMFANAAALGGTMPVELRERLLALISRGAVDETEIMMSWEQRLKHARRAPVAPALETIQDLDMAVVRAVLTGGQNGDNGLLGWLMAGGDPDTTLAEGTLRASDFGSRALPPFLTQRPSLLVVVSWDGKVRLVEELLKRSADVHRRCGDGHTALTLASLRGHERVCRTLILHGAGLDDQEQAGMSALGAACLAGHCHVAELLLQCGARADLGNHADQTPLMDACRRGFAPLVDLLLHYLSATHINLQETHQGRTALMAAAMEGRLEELQLLLRAGADAQIRTYAGKTALEFAETYEHESCCQALAIAVAGPGTASDSGPLLGPYVRRLEGSRVRVFGLQGRKDLNGKLGVATKVKPNETPSKIRLAVWLDDGQSALLRPTNLGVLPSAQWAGHLCRIHGLTKRPDLNGRPAAVIEFDEPRGRFSIRLGGGEADVALRRANVRILPDNAESRSTFQQLRYATSRSQDARIVAEIKEADLKAKAEAAASRSVDPTVTRLMEGREPRDWHYRRGVDPQDSWSSLWRVPCEPCSQGAQPSGPCECGHSSCSFAATSCGLGIHDACVCWQCHRAFSLMCLGGPDSIVSSLGATDPGLPGVIALAPPSEAAPETVDKLMDWGSCPRCSARLGAISMPTLFRTEAGLTMHRSMDFGSDGSRSERETSLRAVSVEIDAALRQAWSSQVQGHVESAISHYTHAVVCANYIRATDRSSNTALVLGLRNAFFAAHAHRAKLEGDMRLYEAIVAAEPASARRPETTLYLDPTMPSLEWKFRDGPHHAFLDAADFAHLWPGPCVQLFNGPDAPAPPIWMPQLPPALHDTKDAAFQALNSEHREMRFWMSGDRQRPDTTSGPGGAWLQQVFDHRWCFRTVRAAREYYKDMLQQKTEEVGVLPLVRTQSSVAALTNHRDAEWLVLCRHANGPPVQGRATDMLTFNVVFRAGRICAKVYFSACWGMATPARRGGRTGEKQLATAKAALLELASRAAARAAEAAEQPLSVHDVDTNGKLASRLLDAHLG